MLTVVWSRLGVECKGFSNVSSEREKIEVVTAASLHPEYDRAVAVGGRSSYRVAAGYNRTVDRITINVETCADSGTLVASWDDPRGGGLTTQANNLSDLEKNIREAVEVYFDAEEMPRQIIKLRPIG